MINQIHKINSTKVTIQKYSYCARRKDDFITRNETRNDSKYIGNVRESSNNKTDLHADDAVDEEENDNQKADVGQGFHRLNERPEQNSHCITLA